MTRDEFIAYMTSGLDADSASSVRESIQAAFKNSVVASRAEQLKGAKEWDDLAAREVALKAELEGGPDKPGAKAYQEWYAKNYPAVQKLMQDKAELEAKLAGQAPPAGDKKVDTPSAKTIANMTQEEFDQMVEKRVDSRIQGGYADRWSNLLTGMGSIVQKHMFAGRKTPIDMKKLAELAAAQGGDLDRAYDEYDKPEREIAAKADEEKRINQRVNEELQKRGAHANFPAGADATPGTLSRDRDASKFDRGAMERDLVNTFISGEEGGGKMTGFGVN